MAGILTTCSYYTYRYTRDGPFSVAGHNYVTYYTPLPAVLTVLGVRTGPLPNAGANEHLSLDVTLMIIPSLGLTIGKEIVTLHICFSSRMGAHSLALTF